MELDMKTLTDTLEEIGEVLHRQGFGKNEIEITFNIHRMNKDLLKQALATSITEPFFHSKYFSCFSGGGLVFCKYSKQD